MTFTLIYPPITISPGGLATEATLLLVNTNLTDVNTALGTLDTDVKATTEAITKDVLAHFFQDPNTLTNIYQTMWTVAVKALEAITIKQNDGNVLSIAVNGIEQIVAPPSGEVQHFPLKAAIGATIDIKVLGTISNAGPIAIEFLG